MVISKAKIGTYLLPIALGLVIFFIWQENSSLRQDIKQIEKVQENERKARKTAFDSITQLIHLQNEVISDLEFDIEDLDKRKADINNQANEQKDRVNSFTSADSLEGFFTRRYR